jgi:hypothetical protein
VKEVSLILRSNLLLTPDEFRILEDYANTGKMWSVTQRPVVDVSFTTFTRAIEYIFDPESLTFFCIISKNILVTWDTDITRHFGPNDEYEVRKSLFIKPYLH